MSSHIPLAVLCFQDLFPLRCGDLFCFGSCFSRSPSLCCFKRGFFLCQEIFQSFGLLFSLFSPRIPFHFTPFTPPGWFWSFHCGFAFDWVLSLVWFVVSFVPLFSLQEGSCPFSVSFSIGFILLGKHMQICLCLLSLQFLFFFALLFFCFLWSISFLLPLFFNFVVLIRMSFFYPQRISKSFSLFWWSKSLFDLPLFAPVLGLSFFFSTFFFSNNFFTPPIKDRDHSGKDCLQIVCSDPSSFEPGLLSGFFPCVSIEIGQAVFFLVLNFPPPCAETWFVYWLFFWLLFFLFSFLAFRPFPWTEGIAFFFKVSLDSCYSFFFWCFFDFSLMSPLFFPQTFLGFLRPSVPFWSRALLRLLCTDLCFLAWIPLCVLLWPMMFSYGCFYRFLSSFFVFFWYRTFRFPFGMLLYSLWCE